MLYSSINPATLIKIKDYANHTDQESEKTLQLLDQATKDLRHRPFTDRLKALKIWRDHLSEKKEQISQLITTEMGKPITASRAEVHKSLQTIDVLITEAEKWFEISFLNHHEVQVQLNSLGVVLAIMPWNFPLWQVVRFVAPALLIGNSVVIKHSEITPGVADLIFPANFLYACNLRLSHDQCSRLIKDHRVRAVTLTGSTLAGRAIAAQAGQELKKCVLELGGCDPYLIFSDADLELAVQKTVKSRMVNTGQSCIAAKRFIVHRDVYATVLEMMKNEFSKYKLGDPSLDKTLIGPLSSIKAQQRACEETQKLESLGAKLVYQDHEYPSHLPKDCFFAPQLWDVTHLKDHFFDEIFAPVGLILKADSDEQMIQLANHSRYGLGAAIFTQSVSHAKKVATQLDVGMVAFNDFVQSSLQIPFGGTKDSGYGRELSRLCLFEMSQIQSFIGVPH